MSKVELSTKSKMDMTVMEQRHTVINDFFLLTTPTRNGNDTNENNCFFFREQSFEIQGALVPSHPGLDKVR